MNTPFSIVDFLILALVVQGLILSGLLVYSSKKIKSNLYIGAFIFVVSEATLMMEIDYWGVWQHQPWLLTIMVPFHMAFGPLIYLYANSLIFADQKTSKNYVHFLPMFLFMKHQMIYLFFIAGILSIPFISNLYVSPTIQNFLFGFNILSITLPILSLIIYSAFTYRMVLSNLKHENLSANKQQDLKWIKTLLQLITVLTIIWIIAIPIDSYFPAYKVEPGLHYFLYIPAIIFVYWLGMAAYMRQNKMAPEDVLAYNKPAIKLYYTDTEAEKYWQQLRQLMEIDKIYLNPLLKIDELSAKLNLPEKSVSSILNQYIGKNFNDFVNGYRVEEAKKKLVQAEFQRFTIAAIAFDCGFNSLATFQRCFKQFTGVTPSKYQNSINTSSLSANTTQIGI